jgi:hypothetical protein
MAIRLSVRRGRIVSPSSSSGLTRGSVGARTPSIQGVLRANAGLRVKPEDDGVGQFRGCLNLILMPMRLDQAIALTVVSMLMERQARP